MTGTAEPKQLQYGEEGDISMLSIAISNGKVILDTKAKPLLLASLFIYLLNKDGQSNYYLGEMNLGIRERVNHFGRVSYVMIGSH